MIEALRTGRLPDYDVYDAASWSAVSALTGEVRRKPRPAS